MGRIASLHIYPVKSCRGVDVTSARLTPTGLEWDRRWMIVDARDRFVTQREHPKLATITTAVADGRLMLSAEGHATFVADVHASGSVRRVRIWKDNCNGIDAGDAAAAWLFRVLGASLRLVRIDEQVPRLANPEFAGTKPQPVTFTDGYPVLMISRESLAELNRRLPAPIPMARFRPNIVIEDVPAHAEDEMISFHFGGVVLRGVKHCTRCSVTMTDQLNGSRDPRQEPLRTLKTYRHDRKLHGVTFGQNCVVAEGVGEMLAVGAPLAFEAHQV
ncbi:MAG: MOSC domain-containing protein [Steroidobacteraceae bacterium]